MKPLIHVSLSRRTLVALMAVGLILAGCAGEQMRREGVNLILEGQVDQGLAKLQEAAKAAPKNADIQMEYLRQRDQVIGRLLTQANSARVQGDFNASAGHYRHVLTLDPNNAMAANGLSELDADRRNATLLSEAQQRLTRGDSDGAKDIVRMILIERPNDPQANLLRRRLEETNLVETVAGPRLNIQGRRPVTLQFRDANLKMVLEAISKATGVNILLDRDVRSDTKVTIFVKDSPVEETLDLILFQNQLDKRILGPSSVLVYAMTPAKQKEYQELKVRRFVLTNADPKQVQGMLKTILKVKDMHVDEKTNAVIVRDTESVVRLAEKLIASIDLAEPEVMLEVQLLDLDRKKTLDLGINWPNTVNWLYPTAAAGNTIREVNNLVRASPLLTFAPNLGATLKALETDGDTRVLATPRIRTRSKEKAKIMIGNRTPIISTAAVPGTGGTGVISSAAVYNTNIQYLDTGIKLEVEPNVYIDGEVSIKINLEVSDLGTKYENTATGTLAYATTTNNATTTLRLKDGETQVLAGLLRSLTNNGGSNKVPGVGDVPLLGRIFGIQSDKWENRELVLAITPHIVRNIQASDADVVEMWSGTDSNVRYNAFHKGPAKVQPVAAGQAPARPAMAEAQEPSEVAAEVAPTPAFVPGTALRPQLTGPAQARVGETITVSVDLANVAGGVNSAIFALKYDMEKLQPLNVTEGSISIRSGNKSIFRGELDPSAAQAIGILKMDGTSATETSGSLGAVQFKVLAAGKAAVYPVSMSAVGTDGKSLPVVKPQPLQVNLVER